MKLLNNFNMKAFVKNVKKLTMGDNGKNNMANYTIFILAIYKKTDYFPSKLL